MKKVYECDEFEYYGIRYCEFKDVMIKHVNCVNHETDIDDSFEETKDIREAIKFDTSIEAGSFIANFFRYPENWEEFKVIVRYEIK